MPFIVMEVRKMSFFLSSCTYQPFILVTVGTERFPYLVTVYS